MPHFNANPGPSIAAAIASRASKMRAAKEARNQKPQKYSFEYKPKEEALVFFYPKAPSFDQQIEGEERRANAAIMSDAMASANHSDQQQQQQQQQQRLPPARLIRSPTSPLSPSSGGGGGGEENMIRNANYNEAVELPSETQHLGECPCVKEVLLGQPQAIAPFAVDDGRGSVAQTSRDNATLSQRRVAANKAAKLTEYQRCFGSKSLQKRDGSAVPARVSADRNIELILQRGGYTDLKSKAASRALPVTWEKPRKEQPPVSVNMAGAPAATPGQAIGDSVPRPLNVHTHHMPVPVPAATSDGGARYASTARRDSDGGGYYPRPRSAEPQRQGQNLRAPSAGSAAATSRPSCYQQRVEQQMAARAVLQEQQSQQRAKQLAMKRPGSEGRTGGRRPASAPAAERPHSSVSVSRRADSLASQQQAKYHTHCASPTPHEYVGKAFRTKAVEGTKAPPMMTPRAQQQPSGAAAAAAEEAAALAAAAPPCHCVCHAVAAHHAAVRANRNHPNARRMLHSEARHHQTSSLASGTGVGMCLDWPLSHQGRRCETKWIPDVTPPRKTAATANNAQ